jgi:hypothetical protein
VLLRPSAEDPPQVLYNRRTLETIWDNKQDVINPYIQVGIKARKDLTAWTGVVSVEGD